MIKSATLRASLSLALTAICFSSYAQIPTTDVQEVCKNRVSAFVAGLETAVVADPNNTQAINELNRINNLSPNLLPCDKQQQIPALVESDRALNFASDAIKNDRN